MYHPAEIIPKGLRRRVEVVLIDYGLPTKKKRGMRAIGQLEHRRYVGRTEWYEAAGQRQSTSCLSMGLQPGDALCDIGCGVRCHLSRPVATDIAPRLRRSWRMRSSSCGLSPPRSRRTEIASQDPLELVWHSGGTEFLQV